MPPVAGITVLALTAAAKAEHAGVTRMVQHRSRTMMFELPPQNLAFARAALNSSREAQLQAAELLDRGGGRADAAERLEEHPQSLLHLLIRIGNHPIGAVICDPITPADVYVHGQAVGLPKWQGWAKAARQKLNAIVEEPRRSRGTMRRAMSSPSTAPTGGSASTRTTSGASSASTTGAARCCSTAARTAWCTGSPPRSAGAAAAPRSTLAEGIELCAGDRIRWTRDDGGLCLVNSRTAEVTAANDGRVTFRLEDGRTLDMNAGDPQLRHIDRASTVHAFQGRTVDNVKGRGDTKSTFTATRE